MSHVSVLSSAVLYGLAGGVWGWVAARLRRSAHTGAMLAEVESNLAVARERENVARTLHDGVLQTLAVVQRRSTDPELAAQRSIVPCIASTDSQTLGCAPSQRATSKRE